MKRGILFGIAALALTVGACGGGEKKVSPEEEVRDYGRYFVEKLAANQIDSIKATYPDIVKGDSLLPVKSDTIIVVESAPGKFDVTLAEGIILKVNRSEEGDITVAESKGLFAFPEDKVELAKKTGMWDDNLTDAQLAERMNDNDFFEWVSKKIVNSTKNIISIGKTHDDGSNPSGDPDVYRKYVVLTNNTDVPVSGSDYKTKWRWETWELSGNNTESGKDIPPHGSVTIKWKEGGDSGKEITGIKWNLSDQELKAKFASYTGKEYQEYLDSKKN